MAKRRNSFDPDALAKAGQEIAKRHQVRENVPIVEKQPIVEEQPIVKAPIVEKVVKVEPPKNKITKASTKKKIVETTKSGNEKTQLCRIGLSYHRRLKFAAVMNDMTIRQYLENLIEEHIPKT
ncbi:MAG: hypothetical protein ACJA1N_001134 [Saprospiraceae bacterium]|jgi:hypothetical protein